MNTHTLELDLSKDSLGGNLVRVGQGDKSGTTIKALVYDGGAEASLSGYTGYLEVLLPNKRNYYRAQCTISGNAATVTVDENKLCSVAGYTDEAYFTFEKSGIKYSTERFAIDILRCVTNGQQPAQSWDDAIDNLITRGNAAVSAANTAADNANAAANRVDGAITSATNAANEANSAANAANAAASAANSAASSANSAASKANKAASAANSAASSANSAVSKANDAADAANTAADRANKAADRVDKAIEDAESATERAGKAADRAEDSAGKANSAANNATEAAKNALRIINSIGSVGGGGSSADVEKVKEDNATLAGVLAELTDGYVVIDDTAFTPQSRFEAFEDGALTLKQSAFDEETLTLTLV